MRTDDTNIGPYIRLHRYSSTRYCTTRYYKYQVQVRVISHDVYIILMPYNVSLCTYLDGNAVIAIVGPTQTYVGPNAPITWVLLSRT